MVALAPFGGWPARYDLAFDYPTNLDTGLLAFVPRDEFWSYSNETRIINIPRSRTSPSARASVSTSSVWNLAYLGLPEKRSSRRWRSSLPKR